MPTRMTAPVATESGHVNIMVEPAPLENFHGEITTLAGVTISTDGQTWHVGPDTRLNWKDWSVLPAAVRLGVERYLKQLMTSRSPEYVRSNFERLKKLTAPSVASVAQVSLQEGGTIGYSVFSAFEREVAKSIAPGHVDSYRAAFRRWYDVNSDLGMPGFDPDVAADLDDLIMSRNPQGHAVLSEDPDDGPLCESDFSAMLARLNNATADTMEAVARNEVPPIPLKHLALTWMFVCYGTNPKNMRYLDEQDFMSRTLTDGRVLHQIRIPRIKKRLKDTRIEFRTRELPAEIAKLLMKLIDENFRSAPRGDDVSIARPMFRTDVGRSDLDGSKFDRHRNRLSSKEVGLIINSVMTSLEVPTIAGGVLRVTPRRLRYTFTARLVANGATPSEVADALDHSSTEHVMVYFSARGELVKHLSKAVAVAMAPIAQAFLGTIIKPDDDVVRGDDPTAAIHVHSPTMRRLEKVGACGSYALCQEAAPIACYTCRNFQPFIEAQHELVLDALEQKRDERIAKGAHPRIIQINDRTMLAVAHVITKQQAWRERREMKNG